MRVTQSLLRQHIGWHFSKHWRVQGRKKPLETGAEKAIKGNGVQILQPEEILAAERPKFEKVEVIGYGIKKNLLDETHPNWNDRTLLTYRDSDILLEGLNQAKVITKTVELNEGLPEKLQLQDTTMNIHKQVQNIILNSHIFDAEQKKLPKIKDPERPMYNFPRIYGITQDRVNKSLTLKLVKLIESTTDNKLVRNRYLFNDLFFSFPFEKNGELIQLQLKGDSLLTSSKPLSPITTEKGDQLDLPDIYPIRETITLNEENIYKLENIYPINANMPKCHPHTIFVHYNDQEVKNLFEEEVSDSQIYGRSLLKTFTVAATYARQAFGKDVQTLPRPVSVQCIQTNGKWFNFGVLQLNTLDLDETTTKNIWYQTEKLPLFKSCSYQTGKPVLEEYNPDIIKQMYAFYNNV